MWFFDERIAPAVAGDIICILRLDATHGFEFGPQKGFRFVHVIIDMRFGPQVAADARVIVTSTPRKFSKSPPTKFLRKSFVLPNNSGLQIETISSNALLQINMHCETVLLTP